MIRIKIYVKDINYNSFVKLLMPYIEKWLLDKDNFFLDILSKIISKKGKPTKFSDLLISLVPRKDDLVTAIIPHFDDIMIEYLNNMLSHNHILAQIVRIKTDTIERNNETLIRVIMDIENIDYEATAEYVMPQIIQKLSEMDDNSGRVGKLLYGMKELPVKVVKEAITAIPTEDRDKIVATILTEYRVELKNAINSIILKNNIKAEISAVRIDNHPNVI